VEPDVVRIKEAARALSGVVHRTELRRSATFSSMCGGDIYLKYENQQKTGSFKLRGAYYKLYSLKKQGDVKTVIAASAGNHAQGVAYAAGMLGMDAVIVMPRSTPIAKVQATHNYGARVVLYGDRYEDACRKALEMQAEKGGAFIHPFEDVDVMAGQGTVGLEILEQLPDADTLILPAGGGGLLAGTAACIKQINPRIRIVGVQSENAAPICRMFHKTVCEEIAAKHTIADGIAVLRPGTMTCRVIGECVDEMATVSDAEIAAAILLLLERDKQVVEPAGAASLAAALNQKTGTEGKKTVCVLSGGNIDVSIIHRIIEKGLLTRGRRMKFYTVMPDVPGSLERFSGILAEAGANIVMVQHDRLSADLDLNDAILHIACEVTGAEHGRKVKEKLEQNGYRVFAE